MPARQPLPRLWLMTDERMGERLWIALARLPRGSGVVFRHYSLAPPARRALFERVRIVARRRRLLLVLAGDTRTARAWRAQGVHGRSRRRTPPPMIRTAPAHDARELLAAQRSGVDLLFLSPVFPTRSHPGAGALGRVRFGFLRGQARAKVVALGGMTAQRARGLAAMNIHGWAAIDAWSG